MMLHMTSGRRGFDYYDDSMMEDSNNNNGDGGYYGERKLNTNEEKKTEKKEARKSFSQVLMKIIILFRSADNFLDCIHPQYVSSIFGFSRETTPQTEKPREGNCVCTHCAMNIESKIFYLCESCTHTRYLLCLNCLEHLEETSPVQAFHQSDHRFSRITKSKLDAIGKLYFHKNSRIISQHNPFVSI